MFWGLWTEEGLSFVVSGLYYAPDAILHQNRHDGGELMLNHRAGMLG